MTQSPSTQPWSERTKKIVFATVAKEVTSPADRALFEEVCLDSGLNPLRKEIYAVVRKGRMSIQTGIDGYLKMANRLNELDGLEVLYYDKEGNASEVWLPDAPPAACLVRVYRKGCSHPFSAFGRYKDYKQNSPLWTNFGPTMIAKCVTCLALRRGFADRIGGIASSEELDQAGLAASELLTQGLPGAPSNPAAIPPSAPAQQAPADSGKILLEVARETGLSEIAAKNLLNTLLNSYSGNSLEVVISKTCTKLQGLAGNQEEVSRIEEKFNSTASSPEQQPVNAEQTSGPENGEAY